MMISEDELTSRCRQRFVCVGSGWFLARGAVDGGLDVKINTRARDEESN